MFRAPRGEVDGDLGFVAKRTYWEKTRSSMAYLPGWALPLTARDIMGDDVTAA